MAAKDAAIATMQKLIHPFQGEIKTLNTKQSSQFIKKPSTLGYKKVNWWSNPYCWTHGVGRHDGEACKFKVDDHNEKVTSLNRMDKSKEGILEGG